MLDKFLTLGSLLDEGDLFGKLEEDLAGEGKGLRCLVRNFSLEDAAGFRTRGILEEKVSEIDFGLPVHLFPEAAFEDGSEFDWRGSAVKSQAIPLHSSPFQRFEKIILTPPGVGVGF